HDSSPPSGFCARSVERGVRLEDTTAPLRRANDCMQLRKDPTASFPNVVGCETTKCRYGSTRSGARCPCFPIKTGCRCSTEGFTGTGEVFQPRSLVIPVVATGEEAQ